MLPKCSLNEMTQGAAWLAGQWGGWLSTWERSPMSTVPHACQGPTFPPAPAVSPWLGKAWMLSCVLDQENVKPLW